MDWGCDFSEKFSFCLAPPPDTQDGQKVKDERKLDSIRHMLDISPAMMEADEPVTTVFELAGEDRAGLLAEITSLLNHNGCETRSAAVWTYRQRVAFVIGVQDGGKPISDGFKLQRLVQIMKASEGPVERKSVFLYTSLLVCCEM